MDFSESTKVVYNRIQKLEPDIVSKIIGYLLIQDHGEREMIRLAFSPDNSIHSLINKAKSELGLSISPVSAPISPTQLNPSPLSVDVPLQFPPYSLISPPATIRPPYWDTQLPSDQQPLHKVDFVPRMQFLTLEDQLETVNSVCSDFSSNYFYPEPALGVRTSRRSPSLPDFPVKVCHYFIKGFCKHGNNCRYFHGVPPIMTETFSQISSEFPNDDPIISTGPFEKLEMEITELLKSRRGVPVSIASLPMLYYEMYGRTLQAEGYLTESQRHGKAGYSLTKLLARLKNSIRLIDSCRPHGQHSVILAEDVPKYLEYASDRFDSVGMVTGSRQIYLTFPAESTFTEQDVSSYFNKFGPVQDVRIPCQQKRMFGFVTFVFAETVKQILAKGNPHFVCGARVLVKPYREKSRLIERKCADKLQLPMHFGHQFVDGETELHSMSRLCDNSRMQRKKLTEEQEQALEFERRQLSEWQSTSKTLSSRHPYFGYSVEELKLQEEQAEFSSAERFNYLLNVLNKGSTSEDTLGHINTSYGDSDSSQGLNLPDSPFASPIRAGISTVI